MDTDFKRSSVVQGIIEKASDEDRRAMKGVRQALDTPMLDVCLRDGHIKSFAYAYLVEVEFDPGDRITLHFGDTKVVIEGRNLGEVRQRIRRHTADEIQEGTELDGIVMPDEAAVIDDITFVRGEQEKQRDDGHAKRVVRR